MSPRSGVHDIKTEARVAKATLCPTFVKIASSEKASRQGAASGYSLSCHVVHRAHTQTPTYRHSRHAYPRV